MFSVLTVDLGELQLRADVLLPSQIPSLTRNAFPPVCLGRRRNAMKESTKAQGETAETQGTSVIIV